MESGLLSYLGVDPAYLIILLFVIQFVLIGFLIRLQMKYNKMRSNYQTFMKGKDGKSIEQSVLDRFRAFDKLERIVRENSRDIDTLYRMNRKNYQKVGIVKYDAFHEMGGNLCFVLTMLDEDNNGWIFNAMHSREGCYTYIKEVVKGESYIELAEEERESLDQAIYQEEFDIRKIKD